jgi:ATP-dependent Clp protease adaptor protein ClpS
MPAALVEPKRKGLRKEKTQEKDKSKKEPRYNVILWNDEEHSYEFVIVMLKVLFGYPPEQGLRLAREVDTQGRAIIWTAGLGDAEIKRDLVLGFGADPTMPGISKGPLAASLERAEDV